MSENHVARLVSIPRRSFLAMIAFLLSGGLAAAASAETTITQCGQVVLGSASLAGDLDCSSYPGVAVIIKKGKLRLNGFTITSNPTNHDPTYDTHGLPAVFCVNGCTVIGPGTITGAGGGTTNGQGCCIGEALSGRRVKAIDVTIEGNGGSGIGAPRLVLDGCTVRNNAGNGVGSHYRTRISDSTIENNGLRGVYGNNGIGSLNISGSTITGNAGQGVMHLFHPTITDSTISGNGTDQLACDYDASPGETFACVDVFTDEGPRSRGLTCETSYERSTDGPSGICSLD